jgi:hypothetical protein
MNEPENFLTRWSRRKLVAEEPGQPASSDAAVPESPAEESESGSKPAVPLTSETAAAPKPQIDPATLPSLDSIDAKSDISAFLKPGVPGALQLAALRRAWSTDPAIRDFKGLQENDWNFNDPNGVFGFGELDPSFDVRQMLTDLFGETSSTHEPRPEDSEAVEKLTSSPPNLGAAIQCAALNITEPSALASRISMSHQGTMIHDTEMSQRDENAARRVENVEDDCQQVKRRRSQGSALPH